MNNLHIIRNVASPKQCMDYCQSADTCTNFDHVINEKSCYFNKYTLEKAISVGIYKSASKTYITQLYQCVQGKSVKLYVILDKRTDINVFRICGINW